MRMTEEEYKSLIARSKPSPPRPTPPARTLAKGRTVRRAVGQMNKTEARYAQMLDVEKHEGRILDYWFEQITFKLADDTRYTPDFVIQRPDGVMEVHEVKGHWEDDALVKIKVAAAQFPFRFIAVSAVPQKNGGGWQVREF